MSNFRHGLIILFLKIIKKGKVFKMENIHFKNTRIRR
jgi:hypothetical protein